MKKLEVLERNTELFGAEFVLPYVACYTWEAIEKAVLGFEAAGNTWGMRTDFAGGCVQGYNLPFVMDGSLAEAKSVWESHGSRLVYIVSHNVLDYRFSGVARPVFDRFYESDDDHVFIEYNAIDNVAQRYFDKNGKNVRRVLIGPLWRTSVPINPTWWDVSLVDVPVVAPTTQFSQRLRFDRLYHLLVGDRRIERVEFSVREPDGKLVIW